MADLTVEERIKNLLVENFSLPGDLAYDQPILSSGMLDSLNVINIFNLTEEEFGISISALDFSQDAFDTINAMSEFVRSKM